MWGERRRRVLNVAYALKANFDGTNLRGADLTGAIDLTQEQIANAFIDGESKLPDGLLRPP